MDKYNERTYFPYSWHQATVLLMVPHNTQNEDLSVRLLERERDSSVVPGVPCSGQGRLYSAVDTESSVWQLEQRASRLSARERTTSTTSTASTHSSYAFVSSDPEISSSFAASLESGQVSESESDAYSSPAASSPIFTSSNLPPRRKLALEHRLVPLRLSGAPRRTRSSRLIRRKSGRLLTIHLEKQKPIIWPSLIVGPLADIRKDKEEAFEYFLMTSGEHGTKFTFPSATMRLVSLYLPLSATSDLTDADWAVEDPARGTAGAKALPNSILEAGLLHLEGAASTLLSASYSSLSSIRMPLQSQIGEGGTEAWKRDREAAAKYFERARTLQPDLDIPSLPVEGAIPVHNHELEIPSLDLTATSTPESYPSGPESNTDSGAEYDVPTVRRRRKKTSEVEIVVPTKAEVDDMEDQWYLYVPGIVGAGTALLVLGVPFSLALLQRLWQNTKWRCCADGGGNRLYDLFADDEARLRYLPDLVKGDLDSLRPDVRAWYASHGVTVVEDEDQDSTDLMKCVRALKEKEETESAGQWDIVILGGLAGRLDHTIHTLAYLHKLRTSRKRVFAVTDDNVGWVLTDGEHQIEVDHDLLGPTCGLLPVGIDSTMLTTTGLRWNLDNHESSFDGLVSTSNHLVPGQNVGVRTTKPIWWTAELRPLEFVG
ncbi:thiamine pyrophosphokinase [Ephemerocybe angulata]|uniref:Thiamine pyrophosphokinase n=1 Tax=Ephemerocybe angulata TaxID=980116 RepID=A0A8H6I4F2_9AGAR|nr:thiamine pyrophosphokinase [Tulosesus angulatus]